MRYLLFALLTLTLAPSCSEKIRGKTGRVGLASASKAGKVVRELENNRFDSEYFEGKAKVKVESKDLNIGGNATIRIERDKAIWVSMKKFGFEGARALIRPDSFFVVNRLNGDYTAEPLSYIEEKYKVPARFDLLQEMMLGNAVFFSRDLSLATEGDNFVLTGRDARFATEHVVDARGFVLRKMNLTELAQNRKLTIENKAHQPVEGLTGQPDFAYERLITVEAGDQSGRFELNYSKLEFTGPLAMPFRKQ